MVVYEEGHADSRGMRLYGEALQMEGCVVQYVPAGNNMSCK